MEKIFISQPINGKTKEEIQEARMKAIQEIVTNVNEQAVILDSWINEEPPSGVNPGIWYLGKSLETLSKADYIYMVDGWEDYRGCVFEHDIALEYGLTVITSHEGSDSNDEPSGN